jgi:hypothetical protein
MKTEGCLASVLPLLLVLFLVLGGFISINAIFLIFPAVVAIMEGFENRYILILSSVFFIILNQILFGNELYWRTFDPIGPFMGQFAMLLINFIILHICRVYENW